MSNIKPGNNKDNNHQSLLVVDDDPKYLHLLESTLRKQGYQTQRASSGESALSILGAFRPDLILLDIVMPKMDGLEVCAQLRQSPNTRDIPVIFLSVRDTPADTINAFEAGAVDYIIKPFSTSELLARVSTHLELKRKRDVILDMNRQLKKEMRERELAEQACHESNEKFKIISEKSLLGIYIWRNGTFEYVNPAFAQIFDYTPEEAIKLKLSDIIHREDCDIFDGKLKKLTGGDLFSTYHQYRGITGKGSLKYLEDYKARITLSDQPAVIGTIVDITHKKIMEKALSEKTQQLEQLNQTLEKRIEQEVGRRREQEQFLMQQSKLAAMGEMVGAIAHQWRQPLSTVGFIVENILDDIENGNLREKAVEQSLNKAVEQIKYMSRTIDDFKTFFKPSKMKEDYDVIQTVSDALSILSAELQNKEIKVIFNRPPGRLLNNGFSNEFKQVLMNLINNGKEAIIEKQSQGQMQDCDGEIIITISRQPECGVIRIKDNGTGIPGAAKERMFEPYFSTKEQGLGIGLYMSKVIVEEHMKGKLYVGKTGDGAELVLELPCT